MDGAFIVAAIALLFMESYATERYEEERVSQTVNLMLYTAVVEMKNNAGEAGVAKVSIVSKVKRF